MNKVAKIVLIIVPTLFQKTVILRIFEQFERICQSEKNLLFQLSIQGHSGLPHSCSLFSPFLESGLGRPGRGQNPPRPDHVRGRGANNNFCQTF